MSKLDKLASDAKRSSTIRDAIVFLIQNIAHLVRAMATVIRAA